MKARHGITLALIVLLVALAFVLWKVNGRRTNEVSNAAGESRPAAAPLVTTARPVRRTFSLRIPWIGTIESVASVKLTALAAGRIDAIEVEDQDRVEAGSTVVRLGGLRIEGERARLAAEVESLQTRLELARQKVGRLEESLRSQLVTRDQVASAKDARVDLETRLREARLQQETFAKKVLIKAPVAGTFTKRRVSEGQEVDAGQVIGDIIDAGHLRIAASLFSPQGAGLPGKEATIRLGENRTLTGRVRSVLPEADQTGATMIWIEGPLIDAQLRPGATVSGSVTVASRREALAVPESAVVYDEKEHPLLFFAKDGAYEPGRVELGLVQEGWVEVLSGLDPDQTVVTRGAYELFYRTFNEQFKVAD